MIGSPAISVLMSVHNGERYLRAAIDSILNQTFTDFEFVIVDDASKDSAPKILQEYAKRDSRVHLITNERNLGLTASLNRGLRECRGEFVARMDADDVCVPQRFGHQIDFMESHLDSVAVGGQIIAIDPYGVPMFDSDFPLSHDLIVDRLLKADGGVLVHPCVLMRKSAMSRIGGYDERFRTAQDLDLYLRLASIGKLANLDEVLLMYRQHLASTSISKRKVQVGTACQIVAEAYSRMGIEMPPDWRFEHPSEHPSSDYRRWGWNALKKRRRGIALWHALSAIKARPIDYRNIVLLACCLRGY